VAVIEEAIAEVGGEPARLPRHPLGSRGVTGEAVDGPGEIEGLLDRPDLLVLARRIDLRRVTNGHPADRDRGAWRQDGVDLDDAVYPNLAALSGDATGEQGRTGGKEAAIADPRAVDMGMRADQNIVAITTLRAPTLISPSSALSTAPNRIRACGPIRTAPQMTAVGATYALGSICGARPRCSISTRQAWQKRVDNGRHSSRSRHRRLWGRTAGLAAQTPVVHGSKMAKNLTPTAGSSAADSRSHRSPLCDWKRNRRTRRSARTTTRRGPWSARPV
jgi:hypothetical protein